MRDTFFREKKKVQKSRSGDPQENAEVYTGKWSYYKLLLFLKDTTTPRATDGNISGDTLQDKSDGDDDDSIAEYIAIDDGNSNNSIDVLNVSNVSLLSKSNIESLIPSTSTSSTIKRTSDSEFSQSRTKKKPKTQEDKYLEDLLKIEYQKVALLEQANKVPVPESDEDMLFFQSLKPYFKKLSYIQKLRVRNQFQNILINELSLLQDQPLNNNSSTYIPEPIPVPQMATSVYSAQQYTLPDNQAYQYP